MRSKEKEIAEIREELHQRIDSICDILLAKLSGARYDGESMEGLRLSTNAGRFKGTKPEAVLFPDGRRVSVRKWKEAVSTLLADCVSDYGRLQYLLELRGRVFGKKRLILLDRPDGMSQPVQIGDGLWMETKYDTETLLNVLMHRVFDVVGYDYGGIRIVLWEGGKADEISE